MDGPNPSEMDIKVLNSAPMFLFTVLKIIFPNWERKNFSLVGKMKQNKIKNIVCMTLNNIANVDNQHPHLHFINKSSSLVHTL